MRIVCPSCGIAYRVPEELLVKRQTLRCSACGVRWHIHQPSTEVAPAPVAAAPVPEVAAPVAAAPAPKVAAPVEAASAPEVPAPVVAETERTSHSVHAEIRIREAAPSPAEQEPYQDTSSVSADATKAGEDVAYAPADTSWSSDASEPHVQQYEYQFTGELKQPVSPAEKAYGASAMSAQTGTLPEVSGIGQKIQGVVSLFIAFLRGVFSGKFFPSKEKRSDFVAHLRALSLNGGFWRVAWSASLFLAFCVLCALWFWWDDIVYFWPPVGRIYQPY